MGAIAGIIILGIIALLCFGAAIALKEGKEVAIGTGVLFLLGLLLLFAFGGLQSVPVKSIGVGQAFGTVNGSVYGPGLHETWQPWVDTTDVDETVQTTTFEGGNCLTVRIGGQQTACADITIQWQIKPGAASALYQDYANSGPLMKTVTDAVVIRELKQVVNGVVGDYNPITDVQAVTGTNTANSQFSSFGPSVLTQMRGDIGARIAVLTVLMPYMHYDNTVEAKLAAIQQAYANYAVAVENVRVNEQTALAIAKLGAPTLPQLVAQCLKESQTAGNPGQCIPGSVSKLAITQGK